MPIAEFGLLYRILLWIGLRAQIELARILLTLHNTVRTLSSQKAIIA